MTMRPYKYNVLIKEGENYYCWTMFYSTDSLIMCVLAYLVALVRFPFVEVRRG